MNPWWADGGTLERWFKLSENLDDHGRKRIDDGEDWPLVDFGERYQGINVACHLHFVLGRVVRQLRTGYLCAEFYRRPPKFAELNELPVTGPEHDLLRDAEARRAARRTDDATAERDYYCGEQSVLINVRKFPQHSEGMVVGAKTVMLKIPSVVRLKLLNLCPLYRRHLAKLFPGDPGPSIGHGHDGELDPVLVLESASTGRVPRAHLINDVIQRGAEVVDAVAKDEANTGIKLGQVGRSLDVEDVLRGVRIELYSEGWKICIDRKRLGDVLFKSVAMFLAPLDLSPPDREC